MNVIESVNREETRLLAVTIFSGTKFGSRFFGNFLDSSESEHLDP